MSGSLFSLIILLVDFDFRYWLLNIKILLIRVQVEVGIGQSFDDLTLCTNLLKFILFIILYFTHNPIESFLTRTEALKNIATGVMP